MYPQDLIEAVLNHCDIVDVISNYLNVIKKGKEFRAVCPFHNDTDPSLMISKEKQIFKCFACGTGGNAIGFVQKYEKISFDEAVRKVAEISSYSDPRLLKKINVKKADPSLEPIYNCINDLQKFYINGLNTEEAVKAKEYLTNRNLDDEVIEKFGIGFSPINGDSTIKYLQAKGHTLKAIEGTGIALAGTSGKDCNAGRITFPLSDVNGQIVGFSARRIIQDDSGKYINSPDGPIFTKSKILYNYYSAKDEARRQGFIYVLEGFMDVIALFKAGIPNAVAIMGTAFTDEHIAILKKLNVEVRLCLDGDNPGQTAMMGLISKLSKSGIQYRIVSNPGDFRDPDEILQEDGKEKLVEKMNNLVEPFSFQLNYYLNTKKLDKLDDKKAVLTYFAPIIGSIKDNIEKDDNIAKLAKATGFELSTIYREVSRKTVSTNQSTVSIDFSKKVINQNGKRSRYDRLFNAELHFLYYMLKSPEAIKFYEQNICSFYNKNHNIIANYILDYFDTNQQTPQFNILTGNILANEEENADLLNGILTNLMIKENSWPDYSQKEALALLEVMKYEKDKIYSFIEVNDAFLEENQLNKNKIIDEYVKNKVKREKWEDK